MNEKWERNLRENIVAYFMLHLCICQVSNSIKLVSKGKGKVHPRTGHEGPEGE